MFGSVTQGVTEVALMPVKLKVWLDVPPLVFKATMTKVTGVPALSL